jgi:integrase
MDAVPVCDGKRGTGYFKRFFLFLLVAESFFAPAFEWLCSPQTKSYERKQAPLGTVQALLGRSSSEMTRDVYLHSIPADARAAVQKVGDLLLDPS